MHGERFFDENLGARLREGVARTRGRFEWEGLVQAIESLAEEGSGLSGLDEKEISDAMRERGLGTPATRASMIETLLRREYVVREGKTFAATDDFKDDIAFVVTRFR